MYLGKYSLNTLNTTRILAGLLYKLSKAGDIFALNGDLGAGKTTFVKYFINQAMHKNTSVPSPSYNLFFKYECSKAPIYHVDAWRLEDSNEVLNLGIIDYLKESIFLIEWANRIEKYLPSCKLNMKLEYNENLRTIIFYGDENWKKRLLKTFNREFFEYKIK